MNLIAEFVLLPAAICGGLAIVFTVSAGLMALAARLCGYR